LFVSDIHIFFSEKKYLFLEGHKKSILCLQISVSKCDTPIFYVFMTRKSCTNVKISTFVLIDCWLLITLITTTTYREIIDDVCWQLKNTTYPFWFFYLKNTNLGSKNRIKKEMLYWKDKFLNF